MLDQAVKQSPPSIACITPHKKECMTNGGGPNAFVRHLIPGLALQTYRLICDAFDPANGPTEMWLLREGHHAKDAQDLLKGDPNATFRFKVPFALIQHAGPRIREALKFDEDPAVKRTPPGRFTVPH